MKSKNQVTYQSNSELTIHRNAALSEKEKNEDARLAGAVLSKVSQMQSRGVSIARYDAKTKQVYFESAHAQ